MPLLTDKGSLQTQSQTREGWWLKAGKKTLSARLREQGLWLLDRKSAFPRIQKVIGKLFCNFRVDPIRQIFPELRLEEFRWDLQDTFQSACASRPALENTPPGDWRRNLPRIYYNHSGNSTDHSAFEGKSWDISLERENHFPFLM